MRHTRAAPGTDWLAAAASAQIQGDLDQALRLWGAYRQVHPFAPAGYLDACRALREAGRLDEAEAVCDSALRRGCTDPVRLLIERARIAEGGGDLGRIVSRWQAVERAFPHLAAGPLGAARALVKAGRLDDAEALVADAMARMPGDLPLARLNAQIAVARQDWPDALRRWNAVLAAHPEDAAALKGRGAALWQVRLHQGGQEDEESGTEAAPAGLVDVGRVADQEAQALVTRFESLGQNCEFGLVQRRFGAEPLGLLRWTFVRPLALAKMLETRFAGLAEPDQVDLLRSAWGEWYVRDRLYNMNFHTFHTGYIANEADYLKKQAARLRWLRDKLVDDLDEGSKIFIYKPRVSTRERHIGAIYNGLRRFERARLLCIGLADETAAPGTIRENARGHLNGYLSVHNPLEHGKWDIPFEEWLSLCRATLAWTDAK